MWKDYFSFNKRQRNGIIVLLFIIVAMIGWLVISNHLLPSPGNSDFSAFKSQLSKIPGDSSTTIAAKTSSAIELNGADFSELGNNPELEKFAKAIVSYRNKLGGFVNKKQLLEVHDIDSLNYKMVCNYVSVDSTKIRKLSLNKATIKELAKHPYIGYYLSQAIVNYREEHGNYKAVTDLLKNAAIDNITFNKLAPYLSVN